LEVGFDEIETGGEACGGIERVRPGEGPEEVGGEIAVKGELSDMDCG